jgi:hypothetical protein
MLPVVTGGRPDLGRARRRRGTALQIITPELSRSPRLVVEGGHKLRLSDGRRVNRSLTVAGSEAFPSAQTLDGWLTGFAPARPAASADLRAMAATPLTG